MSRACNPPLSISRAVVSILLITSSCLIQRSTQTLQFTLLPGNMTIPLNQAQNVTFTCSLSDSSFRIFWVVKFPDIMQNLSTRDSNNMVILDDRGVLYDSSSVTIPGILRNNGTTIRCAALTFSGGEITRFSDSVKLTVAGPPLPPAPVLDTLCASQLEIQWETPYSNENFTIVGYNITVVNVTSGDVLQTAMLGSGEMSYLYALDGENQTFSCNLLEFNVTAVNAVGESVPGTVSGGFPIALQSFESEVDFDVIFLRDGSPIVDVSFEAPFICDYQTSSYTIVISTPGRPDVTRASTYTGLNRMIVEMFDSELQANKNYTTTISIEDEHYEGQVLTATIFSTYFEPPTGVPNSAGIGIAEIGVYAGAAGGVLVFIILLSITLIAITFVCSRKRKNHLAPGATMDRILNNNFRVDQSHHNPFAIPRSRGDPGAAATTGHGFIYETINDYQFQTSTDRAENKMFPQTPFGQPHCLESGAKHQWKREQLRSERDELEDSTYQVMSSASASEDLPIFQPPPHGLNNPPAVSKSTQAYPQFVPQESTDSAEFTSDNNNNSTTTSKSPSRYGHHFRLCPTSSTDGSLLSPILEGRDKTDPDVKFYTVNQPFGVNIIPPLTAQPSSTAAGFNDDDDCNVVQNYHGEEGDGEQDYTFMSQAGTLAGMNSRTSSFSYINGGNDGSSADVGKMAHSRITEC